jgi:hypothetical protein
MNSKGNQYRKGISRITAKRAEWKIYCQGRSHKAFELKYFPIHIEKA